LQGIKKLANLKILNMKNNQLEDLNLTDLEQNAPFLEVLNVANNRICKMVKLTMSNPKMAGVMEVDVSSNCLKSLDFLRFFDNVSIVNASCNQIGNLFFYFYW
jgi:Leucine-rich repeat (LRR) protein